MKNKTTKYIGIGAAIIVVIGIIWGIVANQNSNTNMSTTLKFEKVSDKDTKVIHDDVRSMFGVKPTKGEGQLGNFYKPKAYKTERILDAIELYSATMKGKKLTLDGTKVNSYVGNKFYPGIYNYFKADGDYFSFFISDFDESLVKEADSKAEKEAGMSINISTNKVEYNKTRKIYRVEATGETVWSTDDYDVSKIPIVIYLDKDFNITDVYYGKTFADMKGNLSKKKIQKGIQGISDIQYDISTKKLSSYDGNEQHKTGQQVVGKNQMVTWYMSHQVLLSSNTKNYVNGKLVENLIPIIDAKSGYANKKEFEAAQNKIIQVEEKEAGGKFDYDKRMIKKVDSVKFDSKRQLTKVKTTVTVTLKNGKKGSYKQTYFLDENYHILERYVGTKQP